MILDMQPSDAISIGKPWPQLQPEGSSGPTCSSLLKVTSWCSCIGGVQAEEIIKFYVTDVATGTVLTVSASPDRLPICLGTDDLCSDGTSII
jgi:hypothetical protein